MPVKRTHEFRDPLHDFIELNRQERALVDSVPFQRLRHINQLALTSLVYPGATHKRFEHSLGVMHLARRVFDILTEPANIHPKIEQIVPDREHLPYWKSVLSLAALTHDLGHPPFSHAAEKQILPKGDDHESFTIDLIASEHLKAVWEIGQKIQFQDVQKLAVGQKKLKNLEFSSWESILSEVITGDSFGVDRMDYLLRDSYHAGVGYGKFDHQKLMSSLRILPQSIYEGASQEPTLGIELNGLHSAEALLLARYFMYEQVYFHPVRRIYDRHLTDFMVGHYGKNGYPRDIAFHLAQTDNEVTSAIRASMLNEDAPGHRDADAILGRGHFRLVYAYNPSDQALLRQSIESGKIEIEVDQPINSPAHLIWKALCTNFGNDHIKKDLYVQGSSPALFPVLMQDGRIESSVSISSILKNFPSMTVDSVYASPKISDATKEWIASNRNGLLVGGPK